MEKRFTEVKKEFLADLRSFLMCPTVNGCYRFVQVGLAMIISGEATQELYNPVFTPLPELTIITTYNPLPHHQ